MIRILIVDDQNIVREGIKILLEQVTEVKVVGAAEDGNTALHKIENLKPDIVLLDIDMPGIDGLTVADKIRDRFPQVKIIMLSGYENEEYVRQATKLGAKGYLLKSASSKQLEWSIKLVNQGYSAIKSELLEQQLSQDAENDNNLKFASDLKFNQLDQDLGKNSHDSNVVLPPLDEQENFDQLERLLAKNHAQPNNVNAQQPKRQNSLFHGVKLHKTRKTLRSFEFKLLLSIILFSLGFLVFIALS